MRRPRLLSPRPERWDPIGRTRRRRNRIGARGFLFAVTTAGLVGLAALLALAQTVDAARTRRLPERLDGCRVLRIVDGDTARLGCSAIGAVTAGLTGFDTPEFHEPRCAAEREAAQAARRHLGLLIRGCRDG